jgi:hypothetical protein
MDRYVSAVLDVRIVSDTAFENGRSGPRISTKRQWIDRLERISIRTFVSSQMHVAILAYQVYPYVPALEQALATLQNSLEYRLRIRARAADDLEHLRGCFLLVERLPRYGEQPHIFFSKARGLLAPRFMWVAVVFAHAWRQSHVATFCDSGRPTGNKPFPSVKDGIGPTIHNASD